MQTSGRDPERLSPGATFRAVVVVLLAFTALTGAQGADDAELTKGIAQVQDGYWADAANTLQQVVKRLSATPARKQDLAQAYLWLGIAYAQSDSERAGQASFAEALNLDRTVSLAEGWPAKVARLFWAAKGEAIPVPAATASPAGPVVLLETSLGSIRLALEKDKAPVTVDNFVQYVRAGHYDGIIFHRVIPGFMIQGGGMDPGLKERETRPPIGNEASNGLRNLRGTIAMARTNEPNSATAQFFINVKDNASLDSGTGGAGYAVFGRVVEGMDVVDRIVAVPTATRGAHQDVPVSPVVIRAARVEGEPPGDPGIDTAVVRVALAALREGASSAARVLVEARQGTVLALLSREASGGFYQVIEIESGKQGFVRAEEVDVRFTAQPRAASPFQAQRVDDTSPPAVTVNNDSDRAMTLTLDAQVFSIAPRSERTITVRAGRLSYVASAPGVLPAIGTQEFARGHVYTWRFWIGP